jgi:serine/threonine protein kinase
VLGIPGYKIEHELGRGGMAKVYLALQESVQRRVALKVMSPVLLVDPSFSARFMREARIAANLNHPNIVAVFNVGAHEDNHFIAMEYVPGGDLAAHCIGGMPIADALRIAAEIAGALDYAHAKGFVHRDVKPENILFRDNGSTVLTDFGIARATNSNTQMTKTGAVIGTPQYMSPEQARGKELDGRSDLYALGIVLYEMLTGKVPYEGSDSVAVGIKHVTDPLPRLPQGLTQIQPLLERFLAKDPSHRYQTGDEAVLDIQRMEKQVADDKPVHIKLKPDAGMNTTFTDPPTVPMPTPAPASAKTDRKRVDKQKKLTPVSATPRPDGSLRQEPSLGSIDDFSSFDRTLRQPSQIEGSD